MAYFNYKSHKIYYDEFGTGKPLLMLHGNTASSVMFSEFVSEYAKKYKVILIDFLGCGKSDRIETWAEDLWYDEAMQVISFLDEKKYRNIDIIGASGGALVALNVGLERPDLVHKLIADSFEGEQANLNVTETLRVERENSKHDAGAKMFYEMMNGADWESVVDADTQAVIAHANNIGNFFHKQISKLEPDVLFTGSKEDNVFPQGYLSNLFDTMLQKIGHGQQYMFEHGWHPAMISNKEQFLSISIDYLES